MMTNGHPTYNKGPLLELFDANSAAPCFHSSDDYYEYGHSGESYDSYGEFLNDPRLIIGKSECITFLNISVKVVLCCRNS